MGLAEIVQNTRSPLAGALEAFTAGQRTQEPTRENALQQLAMALQQRNQQRQDAQTALETQFKQAEMGNWQAQQAHAQEMERIARSKAAMEKAAVANEHFKGSAYHDPAKGWVFEDWEKSKAAVGMSPEESAQFPIPPAMYPWVQKWQEDREAKALAAEKTRSEIARNLRPPASPQPSFIVAPGVVDPSGNPILYDPKHPEAGGKPLALPPGAVTRSSARDAEKPALTPAQVESRIDSRVATLKDALGGGWQDREGNAITYDQARDIARQEVAQEVAAYNKPGQGSQGNPDEAAAIAKVPGGAATLNVMKGKLPPDVYAKAVKALAMGHSIEEVSAAVNQVTGGR